MIRKPRSRALRKEALSAYMMLIPTIVGMLMLSLGATVGAIMLSFTNYSVKWPPNIVGLDNYKFLLTARLFPQIIGTTFKSAALNIFPCVFFALLLALLINKSGKLTHFFRAIYFWPVVASMAAVSLLWGFILNPQFGLLNYILSQFGIKGPQWFGSTQWAIVGVSIIFVWKFVGYYMTIFLAGLQNIPLSLYEAAMIDGAGPLRKTISITLPLLTPTIFFVMIMACIASFQVFDPILVTGLNGGPSYSTTTLSYFVYQNAFQYMKMGYASASATVLFIIVALISLTQFKLQDKWVFYN